MLINLTTVYFVSTSVLSNNLGSCNNINTIQALGRERFNKTKIPIEPHNRVTNQANHLKDLSAKLNRVGNATLTLADDTRLLPWK